MTGAAFPELRRGDRAGELEAIAANFPGRDRHGYVIGHYVYRVGVNSGQVSGPHATQADAETARDETKTMDVLTVICGHVFTERGTIVQAG